MVPQARGVADDPTCFKGERFRKDLGREARSRGRIWSRLFEI
jgi:hypothetical protein